MPHPTFPTASLRGLTTAAFTAALAVASHAVAGGGGPHGGVAVLLAVTAAATGVAARGNRASDIRVLATLLAGGQVAGHLALTTSGHSPGETSNSTALLMFLMHLIAVAVGAALVCAGERLLWAVTRAIRRCVALVYLSVEIRPTTSAVRDDQPLQHFRLIAASISHRGPPACARL